MRNRNGIKKEKKIPPTPGFEPPKYLVSTLDSIVGNSSTLSNSVDSLARVNKEVKCLDIAFECLQGNEPSNFNVFIDAL